jgi:DNA-binding NarL/FixJ family response regulator
MRASSVNAETAATVPLTIRIALASDSVLFRSGLRRLFGRDRSFLIVGEILAPPVRSVVRSTFPRILLLDAQMEWALAACTELRQAGGRPWVILVGANAADKAWAVQALKAGAHGILDKSASVEHLLKAVRVVYQGQVWASNPMIGLAIDELVAEGAAAPATGALIRDRLSPREQEVVQLIVRGLSNLEAAIRLGITEATVKAHVTHIFQKLALRGRGQLAARYHESVYPSLGPLAAQSGPG